MRHPISTSPPNQTQIHLNYQHHDQQHPLSQHQQQNNNSQQPSTIYSSSGGGTVTPKSPPSQQLPQITSSATLRRPPNSMRDSIETIPTSNAIDSAMYERDKQIYKCSTMRPSGKYDTKNYPAKPSILNCPLPEIPKEYRDMDNGSCNSKRCDESIPITR